METTQWLMDVGNYYKKMENELQDMFNSFSDCSRCHGSGGFSVYNLVKWVKQAGLIKSSLTTTDLFITFCKIGKSKKTLEFIEFVEVVKLLAVKSGLAYPDFMKKLMEAGLPRATGTTTVPEDLPVVNRLTSASHSTTAVGRAHPPANTKGAAASAAETKSIPSGSLSRQKVATVAPLPPRVLGGAASSAAAAGSKAGGAGCGVKSSPKQRSRTPRRTNNRDNNNNNNRDNRDANSEGSDKTTENKENNA